ncbi:putative ankyrin repeat-containing protein [Trichoderma sp. SZMC 28015]
MRLINTDTLVIEEFGFGQIPNYAILSHRWYNYELNLQDVQNRIWEKQVFTNEDKIKAFEKINRCCIRAKSDTFQYAWIDSCCIDKTSSAELSEAINSMYLWYYKAGRCYAYLSDVQSINTFKESEWFKRGWTLQELLAPAEVFFLDKDWNDLGTKKSLQEAVSDQTRIPVNILFGADLETATVAQRMSWASRRKTTRIEDSAYCLMGIFGINMPLLYGEGERAFIRLQEEIMKISNDHSIFAWRSRDTRGGLLATSPDAFSDSDNIIHYSPFGDSRAPLTVSSKGIHLELRFIGLARGGLGMVILHCAERDKATKPIAIFVKDTTLTMELFERVQSERFECVDFHTFRRWQYPVRRICIRMGRMALMSRIEGSDKQNNIDEDIYDRRWLSSLMNSHDTDELFRVAQAGDQDVVWLWLTRSDIMADLVDDYGMTVLWHAVMDRHEALVRMLLARSDVDADFQDHHYQTPLLWAAQHGHEAIVKLLLDKEVDIEAMHVNQTPLFRAAMNNREIIVRILLENGAEVNARDKDGWTPLSVAVLYGHETVVKLLLENGADIETKDTQNERTSLTWAVINGHKNIVKMLLENGADIETRDNKGQTPLLLAAGKGDEAAFKLLLESGAHIEAKDKNGKTALLLAAGKGDEAAVKLLLDRGADINAKDKIGKTALLLAAGKGEEAAFKLLLERGTDINARDKNGQTALLLTAEKGDKAAVKLLLERGADIEARDEEKWSPLLIAVACGYEGIIKLLLENGADIEGKDQYGLTLRTWAWRNGAYDIVDLLPRK